MEEESGLQISLASHKLGEFLGIPVTNSMLTAWVVTGILLLVGILVGKRPRLIPGKLQNTVEMFFEYLLDLMEQTLGSRALATRYFPLIVTIFLFVLTANMLDFLPIFGTIGLFQHGEFVPLFHAVNADLNSTLALAIISFFVIEISGIAMLGALKYGSKFVNIHSPMAFAVGLLEIIGNLARLVSLSFRLFGSILAGEVLLLVIGSFLPYLVPVPLMLFEVFIGFLQAAIFALLTLAFIKIAIMEPVH